MSNLKEGVGTSNEQVTAELQTFTKVWQDGYFEGDPLDRMSRSSYRGIGYNSVLYTVYVACVKPFVKAGTSVLEIGPGRGAWTKAILNRNPKQIIAIDATSAERTGFWDYVGRDPRVKYHTAEDFSLKEVPDGSIDYFFSFGVFCHIPPQFSTEYIRNLSSK